MSGPSSRSPSQAEALRAAVESYIAEVNTALPGKIVAYDPATQKADVKPLVKRLVLLEDGTELAEELPVISNVPVAFPRSGSFFISFPLLVGDFVELVFHGRSIDAWLAGDGGDANPNDFRTHDLSDAVAHPGLYPFTRALAQASATDLVAGKDGGLQLRIGEAFVEIGNVGGALDFLAKATNTEARLAAVEAAIFTHTHPFVAVVAAGVPAVTAPSAGPPSTLNVPAAPVATAYLKGE